MGPMRTTLLCGRKGDKKAPRSCKDIMAENDRWQKKRDSCEKWKVNNRERYLRVKRECAARPAYLARRRELYQAKRSSPRPNDQPVDLSTSRNIHDAKTATEI